MANIGKVSDETDDDVFEKQGPGVGLRCRPLSSERDSQVRTVKASLQRTLAPYEPVLTYLQSILIWERPVQCVLLYTAVNVVFWFFALTSLRLLCLLATGTALVVCLDTWKNKIWPIIKVRKMEELENESWGLVQPGLLSVPELCQHIAEAWVSGTACTASMSQYKHLNPGKFCLLTCSVLSLLAMVGRYIPGLVLAYSAVLGVLLAPLAAYHRLLQHASVRLEPVLQRLDFSVRGYMMSKPLDNQFLRKSIRGAASGEASDSEEELAAFCPSFDDAVVARELALTDSEHSDAEVSYTDNGTFNLSRGQTPLTEGSEDFDRHSDAEESFARDLRDFPTFNPDANPMDDDDDTSIGLPSLGFSELASHRASLPDIDSDQEDLDLRAANLTDELAGMFASNMIQAALSGALQPQARPQASQRAREGPPRAGAHRSYRKQSSSELDTDWDGEDFEMLDQSELNQMDPLSGTGSRRGDPGQGTGFLSNLLGKPQ